MRSVGIWVLSILLLLQPTRAQFGSTDWVYMADGNGTVFRVFTDRSDYATSGSNCINIQGGRFGIIRSAVVNAAVWNQAQLLSCTEVWIGFSQNGGAGASSALNEPSGEWCWSDGDCRIGGYTGWATDSFFEAQPDNVNSVEHCAHQWGDAIGGGGSWNDVICNREHCYMCERDSCPTGTYANPITGICSTTCPSGYYYDTLNFCQRCPNGQFSLGGAISSCSNCTIGKYNNLLGQSLCFDCPAGRFSDQDGTINCTVCTSGYVSSQGSTVCTECGVGKFSDTSVCSDCPPGRFSNASAVSSCAFECSPGYFSAEGSTSCTECPIGRWSFNPAAAPTGCIACDFGYFRNNRTSDCFECPRGQFRGPQSPLTGCELCPKGSFASSPALPTSDLCDRCPRGKWSDSEGATSSDTCNDCPTGKYGGAVGYTSPSSCISCPAGYFSASEGSSSCQACVRGKFQIQNGQTECELCPIGRFGEELGSTSDESCKVCPGGRYSTEERQICEACPPGTYGLSANGLANATECRICPILPGVTCPAGSRLPFVEEGYFRDPLNPERVRVCIPQKACQQTGDELETKCAEGYEGDLCSQCTPYLYFRKDKECLKCGIQWGKWILFAIFVVAGLYLAFSISTPSESFTSKLRIVLLGLQVLAIFPRLSENWTPQMLRFFGLLSLTNLNIQFFSFECDLQVEYWGMWVFKLFLPFFTGFVLVILYSFNKYVVPYFVHKGYMQKPKNGLNSDRYIYTFVLLLNILYLYMIVTIVDPFQCLKQKDGTFTMLSSPGVQCFDKKWNSFVWTFGLLFGILYTVVIPGVFIRLFWNNRNNIKDDSFQRRFGALTRPFNETFYWYEAVVTAKKMSLVILPDLLSAWISSNVRVLTCFICMFAFFVLDCYFQPYKNALFNRQNLVMSSTVMFVLLTSFVTSRDSQASGQEKTAFTVIAILLVVASVGYSFTTFVAHQVQTVKSRRKNAKFDRVQTKDGKVIVVNYAGAGDDTSGHTGTKSQPTINAFAGPDLLGDDSRSRFKTKSDFDVKLAPESGESQRSSAGLLVRVAPESGDSQRSSAGLLPSPRSTEMIEVTPIQEEDSKPCETGEIVSPESIPRPAKIDPAKRSSKGWFGSFRK